MKYFPSSEPSHNGYVHAKINFIQQYVPLKRLTVLYCRVRLLIQINHLIQAKQFKCQLMWDTRNRLIN
jgi:hypothetical protein